MELRELNRAFDQFSPTQEQKEAIRGASFMRKGRDDL